MSDPYREWLQEQIKYYTNWCMEDAARMGYPGKVRFADQSMRYTLETYEECLEQYEALGCKKAKGKEMAGLLLVYRRWWLILAASPVIEIVLGEAKIDRYTHQLRQGMEARVIGWRWYFANARGVASIDVEQGGG